MLARLDCVCPVTMLGVHSLACAALKLQCVFYTPWPPLGPVSVGYVQQCTRFSCIAGQSSGIIATASAVWPARCPAFCFLGQRLGF